MTDRTTASEKAGLIFPVGRIGRYLRQHNNTTSRMAVGAPVYLAAVLEYLTAEILELAAGVAMKDNKVRITPRHIMLAIKNDSEFNELLKNDIVPEGGVKPDIPISIFKSYWKWLLGSRADFGENELRRKRYKEKKERGQGERG